MSHSTTLLPWLMSGLFAVVSAHALASKAIYGWGKLALFTRKDNPLDYWIAVCITVGFAAGMFSVAVLQ